MFNANWVNGKDVNAQSIDYQYVTAESQWESLATLTASPVIARAVQTSWEILGGSTTEFRGTRIRNLETSWEAIAETTFNSIRGREAACIWVGLADSEFIGDGVVSLISAPPHRCFKVGPYTATFYVNDLYRDQAA
tara:strand:- start:443 stop:850 length:408 start_codon:yes stop_codon:yes gene_type:complete